MKTAYSVGIYCRLSREDNKNDVSMSISNQRDLLVDYAEKEGWNVYRVYVDDGISGTTFDRKDFKQMIQDIEDGKVNCVLTKDLSRLGRNYVETGQYTDFFFPNHNVRYIAVNDGVDTIKDDNDIAPFKNILNEMYAKDISRKVKSTKRVMSEKGQFANSRAPYGYVKSKEDKHILMIDDNVCNNIVRIYELYLSGMTARAIADMFNAEGILSPNEYWYDSIGKPNPYSNSKNVWCSGSIVNIIKNPSYYGAIANGKRAVTSFKNKRVVRKSFEDWIIVEDKHEAIITKEIWLEAQKINSSNKKNTVRRSADGEVSIFASVIKCASCGANMVFNRKTYKSGVKEFFRCSTYTQKGKNVCNMHNIDYETLYGAVLADIQRYAKLTVEDENKMIERILKANNDFKLKNVSRYEKNIREAKNRIREIDGIIQNLYEDKISGDVTVDMFKRMAAKYEGEQRKLTTDVEQMECELAECLKVEQDMSGWIQRIKECLSIQALTRDIVVGLIDRIEVSETTDDCGLEFLDMEIYYKFGLKNSTEE